MHYEHHERDAYDRATITPIGSELERIEELSLKEAKRELKARRRSIGFFQGSIGRAYNETLIRILEERIEQLKESIR
jgi:hypothetical protein